MAKKPPSTMKVYKAYFFRGADPVISELKEFVGNATDRKSLSVIEKDGGPAAGTMRNWFTGKTMRPQNATIEAAGRALGMRRVWMPDKGKNDHGKKR